jgi:hypothetical protein
VNFQQFDIEHQRTVGRDITACTAVAIAELGRNDHLALAAYAHALDGAVHTGHDLISADGESEWMSAVIGAVELCAVMIRRLGVVEPARVVDRYFRIVTRCIACTYFLVRLGELRDVIGMRSTQSEST